HRHRTRRPKGSAVNRRFFITLFTALTLPCLSGNALDVDRYAWEFPAVTNIPAAQMTSLTAQLIEQVDDIIAAGNLPPARVNNADELSAPYFVYLDPGRIVTTLAWAYPHLPADRQAAVQSYVHAQFESDSFAPWNLGRLEADIPGTRREFYPIQRVGN